MNSETQQPETTMAMSDGHMRVDRQLSQGAALKQCPVASTAEDEPVGRQLQYMKDVSVEIAKTYAELARLRIHVWAWKQLIEKCFRALKLKSMSFSTTITPSYMDHLHDHIINLALKYDTKEINNILNNDILSNYDKGKLWKDAASAVTDNNPQLAIEYALNSYLCDPDPYRLKYLAFLLLKTGDSLQSDAILALLPDGVNMNAEERKKYRLMELEVDDICTNFMQDKIKNILNKIEKCANNYI